MAHDPERPAPWARGDGPDGSYNDLADALGALLEGETDAVANVANAAAALFATLPDLNWAGFYVLRGKELVLGPFQELPACARIPLGRGVCGTAAAERRALLVPDVSAFPGHIACDLASRSELVCLSWMATGWSACSISTARAPIGLPWPTLRDAPGSRRCSPRTSRGCRREA